MSDELRYGMIKCNKKKRTVTIIDRIRTMMYDSKVGFLDLKALSLKNNIGSDAIFELIVYVKPLLINARDRNTINSNDYQFYFNKLSTSKDVKTQNDVLIKETVNGFGLKTVSSVSGIMASCFIGYNYMSPDTTVETAALVADATSNIL